MQDPDDKAASISEDKHSQPGSPKAPFCSWTANTYSGVGCSILCFFALIGACATNHWINTTVDRDYLQELSIDNQQLAKDLPGVIFYRNSHRGLFSTCYDPTEDYPESICVPELGYEIKSTNTVAMDTDKNYRTTIHLLRLILASIIFAALIQFLILPIALFTSMDETRPIQILTVMSSLGFLFSCSLMGCFHGVDYYETYKLDNQEAYPAAWERLHPHLAAHHTRQYGYSIYLGWLAVAFACVSFFSFFISMISLRWRMRHID